MRERGGGLGKEKLALYTYQPPVRPFLLLLFLLLGIMAGILSHSCTYYICTLMSVFVCVYTLSLTCVYSFRDLYCPPCSRLHTFAPVEEEKQLVSDMAK